jgi:hypothetical protein
MPQSLADATLDRRKPQTRAAEVPRCTHQRVLPSTLAMGRAEINSPKRVSILVSRRLAEARCDVCLFSPYIVSARLSADIIRSHTLPTQGGGTIRKPAAVKQPAKRSGAQGNPHVEVSTRTPKSAAHPFRSNRVPGP